MELSDLTIFRTVVESGGITRAAEKLHRVQSNVTTRISQLEADLGVKLFVREGKKMRLSPAGSILLERANRLLDLAREAKEAVHEETPSGLLRIGTGESTAAVRLPGPLSEFHRRFPQVTLELQNGNPQELIARLLIGELDTALIIGPVNDDRLEKLHLYEEELIVVAPKRGGKIRALDDFKGSALLAFEHGCPYRMRLENWVSRESGAPPRIAEMSSYHALLGCVVAGMGIALVPKSVLPTFPGRKHLNTYLMPKEQSKVDVWLVWRKEMYSARVQALADTLSAAAKKTKKRSRK